MATILVVDDRPTNRQFLTKLLGYYGHRMLEAGDGAEALEQVRAERPDLVITDIVMPTVDGFEFVRRLRAEPATAGTAVIFYTATYHQQEARDLARSCGVEHVLLKPSQTGLIVKIVNDALKLPSTVLPPPPEPEGFQREHTALLTDTLAQKITDLETAHAELARSYDATLEGWVRALDLRDKETEGHSQRVTAMTVRLARAMGIVEPALNSVRRGALLHDIGKLGIPDRILLKPEPLDADDLVVMQRHPEYAHEMLSPIPYLWDALDIPYCHHEKWDGTGYPRGLKGEDIPFTARIFAVVDVFDALSHDRPYRQAWPVDRVRKHILAQSGIHFDPDVVATFLELIGDSATAPSTDTNEAQ